MKKKLFLVLISIFLLSCSLDYEKEENPESSTPEFTFNNANFTRIEKNKKTMKLNAEKLEQYKSDSASFAKNAEFSTFDQNGADETKGSCEIIYASSKDDRYVLLGDIKLNIISENMEIFADSLKFDKKNEQITSGMQQKVTISRDDIDVTGYGFSASGISKTFNFLNDASGTIETNNSEENENSSDLENKEE